MAFAIAAAIGIAIFLIWWLTSDVRLRLGFGGTSPSSSIGAGGSSPAGPAAPPSKEEILEAALPRGGSLTGSTDRVATAADRLTGAALVRVNRSTDGLEPWLAESWIPSADNLIYTVKLRPGLTSAAGAALTAEEAARSLGAITALGQPVTLRALDPLTLEVRFAAPFAPGLRLLDRHPIPGFGPFVEDTAASKRSGPRTFRRNPNYWRKAADGSPLPYLDEIMLADAAAHWRGSTTSRTARSSRKTSRR